MAGGACACRSSSGCGAVAGIVPVVPFGGAGHLAELSAPFPTKEYCGDHCAGEAAAALGPEVGRTSETPEASRKLVRNGMLMPVEARRHTVTTSGECMQTRCMHSSLRSADAQHCLPTLLAIMLPRGRWPSREGARARASWPATARQRACHRKRMSALASGDRSARLHARSPVKLVRVERKRMLKVLDYERNSASARPPAGPRSPALTHGASAHSVDTTFLHVACQHHALSQATPRSGD